MINWWAGLIQENPLPLAAFTFPKHMYSWVEICHEIVAWFTQNSLHKLCHKWIGTVDLRSPSLGSDIPLALSHMGGWARAVQPIHDSSLFSNKNALHIVTKWINLKVDDGAKNIFAICKNTFQKKLFVVSPIIIGNHWKYEEEIFGVMK